MPAKRKKKSANSLQGRLLRWCFHPRQLAVWFLMLAALWYWPSVKRKLPDVSTRDEYLISEADVSITPPPRWVPDNLVERVFARAGLDHQLSLQDPKLSEKVALAFHTHPWIERLVKVRKSFPARVHIEVVYRTPAAIVEVTGVGMQPVDRHGVLLPEEDFSTADIDRYPLIRGVVSNPIRRGQPWGDGGVESAAELAAVLNKSDREGQTLWRMLGLRAIEVPQQASFAQSADNLQLKLVTQGGSEILWGRRPSTTHPAELSVAQKLQRLTEYHRSYNGFDSAPNPYLIDIRHWQVTKRSLLSKPDEAPVRL